MRLLFAYIFLCSLIACSDRGQTAIVNTVDTATKVKAIIYHDTASLAVTNSYGLDLAYEISIRHNPFMVTGYFNPDANLDTGILVRHKSTGKDALFIKHGGKGKSFLIKNGNEVGSDFGDFHWVGNFEVIKKGTKVWNNVVDGEILADDQVPEINKVMLQTDGIFLHEKEGGGGGIIYFSNGKYVWVQQD